MESAVWYSHFFRVNNMKAIFILLVFMVNSNEAQTKMFCASPECQMDWTPYTNMVAGLVGYDPAISNPFHVNGDPGLKNQIFLPTFSDEETTRVYLPGYINAEDNLRFMSFFTSFELQQLLA